MEIVRPQIGIRTILRHKTPELAAGIAISARRAVPSGQSVLHMASKKAGVLRHFLSQNSFPRIQHGSCIAKDIGFK